MRGEDDLLIFDKGSTWIRVKRGQGLSNTLGNSSLAIPWEITYS